MNTGEEILDKLQSMGLADTLQTLSEKFKKGKKNLSTETAQYNDNDNAVDARKCIKTSLPP